MRGKVGPTAESIILYIISLLTVYESEYSQLSIKTTLKILFI